MNVQPEWNINMDEHDDHGAQLKWNRISQTRDGLFVK